MKNRYTKLLVAVVVLSMMLPQSAGIQYATDGAATPAIPEISSAQSEEDEKLFEELKQEAAALGIEVLPTDHLIELYEKIDEAKDKKALKDLQVKAKALGIKVDGLSYDEALAVLSKAISKVQANDPKVVTTQKTLMSALLDKKITSTDEKNYKASVVAMAKQLEINISGLSVKDAIKKVKSYLGKLDMEGVTTSYTGQTIIEASYAIRTKNKAAFLKISQSGAFDEIFKMKVSELSYEKASYILVETLKKHENIDITKGKWDDIKSKLIAMLKEGLIKEAEFYKVDIRGLSDAEAEAKIEIARQIMMANEMIEMQKYADIYKVNVTGLSKEEGWMKIKAVMFAQQEADRKAFAEVAASYGVDIKGLSDEEAKEKVTLASLQAEAAKYNVDISGLNSEEAWKVIKEAEMKIPKENTLEQEAAKWGVDITGLSPEEAKIKVDEARKKAEMDPSTKPADPTAPVTPGAPK